MLLKYLSRMRDKFFLMSVIVSILLLIITLNLFLFVSNIKYFSIIFNVVLILFLTCYLIGYGSNIIIKMKFNFNILFDFSLLFLSILSLLLQPIKTTIINMEFYLLPIAIILCCFLPGYWLIRLFKLTQFSSGLEQLSLSFVSSIPLISLIYTFILNFFIEIWRPQILSIFFIFFSSSLVAIKQIRAQKKPFSRKLYLHQIILFLILILFFVLVVISLYGGFNYLPDLDITRHFESSTQLNLDYTLYRGNELWFHIPISAIQIMSTESITFFNITLVFLSLILIVSFYIMAKTYLYNIDNRLPILATILYFFSSGFGWIYFLNNKLLQIDPSQQFTLLIQSSLKTYNDTYYGSGILWFWFRPWTIGFIILFVFIYLLRQSFLTKRVFMSLSSIMGITLIMTHFSEFLFLIVILCCLTFFSPNTNFRAKDLILSNLIAIPFSILISTFYRNVMGLEVSLSNSFLIISFVILASSYILLYFNIRFRIKIKKFRGVIVLIILSFYLGSLLYWMANVNQISTSFYAIGTVPLEFFSLLLGITGLFSILGAVVIIRDFENHHVLIFILIGVFAIMTGKTLSLININYISLGYTEKRIIPIVSATCSILASVAILETIKETKSHKEATTALFLSLIIIGGTTSNYVALEFWNLYIPRISFTHEEINSINKLNEANIWSSIISATSRSSAITEFSPIAWVIADTYKKPIWLASNPEMPMSILLSINGSSFIYVNKNDETTMFNDYNDGFLVQHFFSLAPIYYASQNIKIFKLPPMSPPSSISDIVFVLPLNENYNDFFYVIDILSQGKFNYTIVDLSDLNTINTARVIIVPTSDIASKILEYKDKLNLQIEALIVLNLDGYCNSTSQSSFSYANASCIKGLYGEAFLPFNIKVPLFQRNESILAYFEPAHIPFSSCSNIKNIMIYYINIYPIIQELETTSNKTRELFSMLGSIIKVSGIILPSYNFNKINPYSVINNLFAFKEIDSTGQMIINSCSMVFSNFSNDRFNAKIGNVTIETNNVSKLIFVGAETIDVITDDITITNRYSFYLESYLEQPNIEAEGKNLTAYVFRKDGTLEVFKGETMKLKPNSVHLLARQPTLTITGNAIFKSFYGYGDLAGILQTLGQDLQITGEIKFKIEYSDTYLVGHNFEFYGDYKRNPPVYEYDEIKSFINYLPYVFLVFVSLSFYSFYYKKRLYERMKIL